jgi:putative redox protein
MSAEDGTTTIAHVRGAADNGAYRVDLKAGRHVLIADEPPVAGGGDLGPSPYQLLLSALAACTCVTLRMYAERKGWPLSGVHVDLRFHKALDGGADRIDRMLTLDGDLAAEQRAKLADVAERTPVTLTLKSGVGIVTELR